MADRPSRRAPIRIAISIPKAAWLGRLPDARARCRRLAQAALAAGGAVEKLGPSRSGELSLVLADDALLRQLNRTFRGLDKPTNVLSFAGMEGGPQTVRRPVVPLGDVAIAYETTASEARAQGKTLVEHLSHLVVHGVLHLLGYDHLVKAQAKEMESLETAVLARFGLSDPYRARLPRKTSTAAGTGRRGARARP